MEIQQLILRLQTPSGEKPHYKVGPILARAEQREVEEAICLLYKKVVEKRNKEFLPDSHTIAKINLAAKRICQSKNFGLVLYGNIGSGKTMLLMALHSLFLGVGYNYPRMAFLTASMLHKHFAAEDSEGVYKMALECEILLLDDLGCEPESCMIYGVHHHPITDIIYERYRYQRTTIITTNLTDAELTRRYGHA